MMDRRPPYLTRILVCISQLVNVVLLDGDPDEMLSSRAYRCNWTLAVLLIDSVFWWQKDHCKQSYDWEKRRVDTPIRS